MKIDEVDYYRTKSSKNFLYKIVKRVVLLYFTTIISAPLKPTTDLVVLFNADVSLNFRKRSADESTNYHSVSLTQIICKLYDVIT